MANSVQQSKQGPVWVLGNIVVPTPGTPVRITNLVDSAAVNAPEAATSSTSDEYTSRAQSIIFQACKAGASHGMAVNTGNVYIIMKAATQGSQNRDDPGNIVAVLPAGSATVFPPAFVLSAAALNRNAFSLYEFWIDADNANDGCQVVAIIQ